MGRTDLTRTVLSLLILSPGPTLMKSCGGGNMGHYEALAQTAQGLNGVHIVRKVDVQKRHVDERGA